LVASKDIIETWICSRCSR